MNHELAHQTCSPPAVVHLSRKGVLASSATPFFPFPFTLSRTVIFLLYFFFFFRSMCAYLCSVARFRLVVLDDDDAMCVKTLSKGWHRRVELAFAEASVWFTALGFSILFQLV